MPHSLTKNKHKMKVIPLSEGAFTVDASKKFIPFNVNEDTIAERSRGSLLVEIQPFVVITNSDIILLDTGLGLVDTQGQFQLYKNLRDHGINASDVSKVIMSHLHKDHAGGLFNPYTKHLAFENAVYHVQKEELEYALNAGTASYDVEIMEQLQAVGTVVFEAGEQGAITEGITYEITGAHSKYHRVIWIKEANETIFFGADDAPQLSQMKTRFAAKYDYDGKKAMQLRDKWLSEGKGWEFLFYHDIKTPTKIFAE